MSPEELNDRPGDEFETLGESPSKNPSSLAEGVSNNAIQGRVAQLTPRFVSVRCEEFLAQCAPLHDCWYELMRLCAESDGESADSAFFSDCLRAVGALSELEAARRLREVVERHQGDERLHPLSNALAVRFGDTQVRIIRFVAQQPPARAAAATGHASKTLLGPDGALAELHPSDDPEFVLLRFLQWKPALPFELYVGEATIPFESRSPSVMLIAAGDIDDVVSGKESLDVIIRPAESAD